jgi:hypothetical protein
MPEGTIRIGEYLALEKPVARGGMAVIYLARHPRLDRQVALKRLNLHTDDPDMVERFVREADLGGRLIHHNIVRVYDRFEYDSNAYIAMDYLERGSLRPFVHRGLNHTEVFGVLQGLLDGLGYAERLGVAHRDMKPDNVLVDALGQVQIADFGIAKAYTKLAASLTQTGSIGTPNYMAPEQIRNRQIGPYTDLYAVGAMAYEMLEGHPPFGDAGALEAIIHHHLSEPPPPFSAARGVSPRLADWVMWLLEKEPADRPQSADEAWRKLVRIAVEEIGPYWSESARLLGREGEPSHAARKLTAPEIPRRPRDERELRPRATDDFETYAGASLRGGDPDVAPFADPVEVEDTPAERHEEFDPSVAQFVGAEAPVTEREEEPEGPGAVQVVEQAQQDSTVEPQVDVRAHATTVTPKRPATVPVERHEAEDEEEEEAKEEQQPKERKERRPWPRPPLKPIAAGVAAALVVAFPAVLAYNAAPPKITRAPTPLAGTITAQDIAVRAPAGWTRSKPTAADKVPNLTLRDAIAIRPAGATRGDGVVVGWTDGTERSLIPAATLKALGDPEQQRVKLGASNAFGYGPVESSDVTYTLYAVPTAKGVATVVCRVKDFDEVGRVCDGIADSLKLRDDALGLPPRATYAKRLDTVMVKLRSSERSAGRRLNAAGSGRTQATAAQALAGVYGTAASSLDKLHPAPWEAASTEAVRKRLRTLRRDTRLLADAARGRHVERYNQRKASIRKLRAGLPALVRAAAPR